MALQKSTAVIGYSNYVFFSLTVIAVLVFLLDASKTCDTNFKFCNIAIFLLVFTVSMAMLLLLSLITGMYKLRHREDGKVGGAFRYRSTTMFFLQDPDLKQIILIPVGLALVFGVSYGAILANQPFLGILASGAIMMTIFFYTNSAFPVILIHGLYNAIVVLIRAQGLTLFATSPIKIPEISLEFFDQRVVNEMLTQILLVAPAEELFKIFVVTVFLIIMKLKFDYSGVWSKVISGLSAILIWGYYHMIVALP